MASSSDKFVTDVSKRTEQSGVAHLEPKDSINNNVMKLVSKPISNALNHFMLSKLLLALPSSPLVWLLNVGQILTLVNVLYVFNVIHQENNMSLEKLEISFLSILVL